MYESEVPTLHQRLLYSSEGMPAVTRCKLFFFNKVNNSSYNFVWSYSPNDWSIKINEDE